MRDYEHPRTYLNTSNRLRPIKAVHGDVHMLLNVGILQKTQKGQIEFPFDAVHVNFMLEAA